VERAENKEETRLSANYNVFLGDTASGHGGAGVKAAKFVDKLRCKGRVVDEVFALLGVVEELNNSLQKVEEVPGQPTRG
jgi:hypothetical protein